jgi:hypothetical protein
MGMTNLDDISFANVCGFDTNILFRPFNWLRIFFHRDSRMKFVPWMIIWLPAPAYDMQKQVLRNDGSQRGYPVIGEDFPKYRARRLSIGSSDPIEKGITDVAKAPGGKSPPA